MTKKATIYLFILIALIGSCKGDKKPLNQDKYLLYLHGGIVQDEGPYAVSQYYGPYEYYTILDTLRSKGFTIISEVRPKDTDILEYAQKVSAQIDSLINMGQAPGNIVVVGASLGGYITVEAANILKNPDIKYVLIGLCSEYALDLFSKYKNDLCGDFLSVFETTDEKGSCLSILDQTNCGSGYQEIEVSTGLGHGFLYKPYQAWVDPMVAWINK